MSTKTCPLYPLTFEPIYKEKVWGGRRLEALGRKLPGGPDTLIGESWEVADLAETSASGGGGGAERSVVAHGPLAGTTLHDLITTRRRDMLGDVEPTADGGFPLLVKFLDAGQNLSVQVHPSPAYARTHPEAYLKSEAWYVVDAAPGAAIYKGVKPGVTREQFARAIRDDAVEPLLIRVEVKPGDCHYLPSGTCHALGAGVLVAEVQTPSDTTFRVYDWGRVGRELHIAQALQCITYGPAEVAEYEKHLPVAGKYARVTRLVECEHFRIDRVDADQRFEEKLSWDQPVIWMMLAGGGTVTCGETRFEVGRGQTVLFPPAMPTARLDVRAESHWLEVSFPQAQPPRLA